MMVKSPVATRGFAFGLAAIVTTATVSFGQVFQGLGFAVDGAATSYARAVTGDGRTVYVQGSRQNRTIAMRWTDGVVEELFPEATNASVSATSHDGTVLIAVIDGVAFRCENDACEPFPPPQNFSIASISPDGTVAVGYAVPQIAAYWVGTDAFTSLGAIGPSSSGQLSSFAYSATTGGTAIVGTTTVTGFANTIAFRWTAATGMELLGDLPGGFFGPSLARAITPDGSVIVGIGASSLGPRAFRWSGGVFQNLGQVPNSTTSSATGVSADGQRIIGSVLTTQGSRPFLWDAENGMRLLSDVLTNDYGVDLTGWTLIDAAAISADGSTIIGIGTTPLGTEAWIARLTDCAPVPGDVDGDRDVDLIDLATLLSNFGRACQ